MIHNDMLRADRILRKVVGADLRFDDYQTFTEVLCALSCYQLYLQQRVWSNEFLTAESNINQLNTDLRVEWVVLYREGGSDLWKRFIKRFGDEGQETWTYFEALKKAQELNTKSYEYYYIILPLDLFTFLNEEQ